MLDKSKYVVLDIETNGLNSEKDDILSISFYLPDEQKEYTRFLPLELNSSINPSAFSVNRITVDMVKNQIHIKQEEFNQIAKEYHLFEREILHFGRIDRSFLKRYIKRHHLVGFSKMNFHDIKTHFATNSFSTGVFNKDNLCKAFGIEGVTETHTGINDCKLEWQLFEKINGKYILGLGDNRILGKYNLYELSDDYYVPASSIRYFKNLKHAANLPAIKVRYELIKEIQISNKYFDEGLEFGFQPLGFASEKVITAMLNAAVQPKPEFVTENFKKLKYLTSFNAYTPINEIEVEINEDGSLTAVDDLNAVQINKVNKLMDVIRKKADKLIEYIGKEVFKNKPVKSQELVINDDLKVFGFTDFSNECACMEMKFGNSYILEAMKGHDHPLTDMHKYQFYVLSNGRPMYLLVGNNTFFFLYKLSFEVGEEGVQRIVDRVYKTRKVLCYDVNGNYIKTYNSPEEAAKAVGVTKSSICDNCRGRSKTSGGFQFKYEGSDKIIEKVKQ